MNNFLSTTQDKWITEYREGNPIWIATLNSGLIVYRDDGRWDDAVWSAWQRLHEYCILNTDYIVSLRFGFRSNMFNLIDDQEGYFFSLACRGYPSSSAKKVTRHIWKLGTLQNGMVRINNFFVPEFVSTDIPTEIRDLEECTNYSLIRKPHGST